MQNEFSGPSEGPTARPRSRWSRLLHGKLGEKIWLDIPCERCEKERCRRLGLKYPQPDWGTAAWLHPQPDTALPAFSVPPMHDRVPEWLVQAADLWASKVDKRPAYPESVEPSGEEEPSSWSTGSGGSAPF